MGYIGAFGKICVALWAFLSGIGAYYTYKKGITMAYRSNLIRLANLMILYVLILFVVFIPLIWLLHPSFVGENYDLSVYHIVCNIFACDAEYDKAAWYLRFYIMFVVSFPLILLAKRKIKSNRTFYVLILLLFLFLPKLINPILGDIALGIIPLKQALGEYCSYILIVISGYAVAEYNLFECVQNRMGERKNLVVCVISLFVAMTLRSYAKYINLGIVSIYTDIVITPFVVYAFFVFFQRANDIVKHIFVYIGKASMVVWLVHWVFNVGVCEIQRVAYFPKVSYLVVLWVLVMCLAFNSVFTYVIKRLHILIKIDKKK